ncbi:MAG: hypothetical protein FWF53_12370 [Candidatus Azobacteroides sp.]|nr:hypothetical protein [Candidatus Azobacteroides sp.]
MSTAELEMRKAQLARKILNEKDENIIVSMEKGLRKIKHSAMNIKERRKLINEFLQFIEINSITDSNFKFNREDCYDREILL